MRIAVQADIEAPPEAVWAFMEDPAKRLAWMPDVAEIDYPSGYDRDDPVGIRFRQIFRGGGRRRTWLGEITGCERHRLLAYTLHDGHARIDAGFRLRPMGTGTRVDYCADYTASSRAAGLLQFLARRRRARRLARQLEILRRIAEDAAAGLDPNGVASRSGR